MLLLYYFLDADLSGFVCGTVRKYLCISLFDDMII